MNRDSLTVFRPFSPETTAISHLFILVLLVCGVILLIVVGMVVISLIRFRQWKDQKEPAQYFGNRKLEIIWTIVPTVIVIWFFVLTARAMHQSDSDSNQAPDIVVIGHQWWWEVRYPQTGVTTANEIHIPIGRKFRVRLESADVIHDFWVPALARKIQMIPGQTNHIWLEADAPGKYRGTCAEYCGVGHSWMLFSVIAEVPAEFDAWLHGEENLAAKPATESAQGGLRIFKAMTCVNCHSIRGVSIAMNTAPDLTHLADRQILGAGVLPNTETNLFRWLKNPQVFKPGCLMPNLKLTDAQAGMVADYLEALK